MRFEVLTAAKMLNVVLWVVTPCHTSHSLRSQSCIISFFFPPLFIREFKIAWQVCILVFELIVKTFYLFFHQPVTVAVLSEAWVLACWLLGSWVLIPLKAWMFVRVFLYCVVLCRQRPCDGLITYPRSPTICLNSSWNHLYLRRPRSFKDCRAAGKSFFHHIVTKILCVLSWLHFLLHSDSFEPKRTIQTVRESFDGRGKQSTVKLGCNVIRGTGEITSL
jgi:hypothetical protein